MYSKSGFSYMVIWKPGLSETSQYGDMFSEHSLIDINRVNLFSIENMGIMCTFQLSRPITGQYKVEECFQLTGRIAYV